MASSMADVKKKCNLCESINFYKMAGDENFTFLNCMNCGFQFADPIPSEEKLQEYYQNFPDSDRVGNEMDKYVNIATRSLRHQISVIQKLGGCLEGKRRFLDIGFGGGQCLLAALNLGFETFGIEIDATAFSRIRDRAKNVYNCGLKQANFNSNFFDFIKAAQVLEHSRGPILQLENIFRILKKGGFLIVDVPNQESLLSKFKILLHRLKIRKDYGFISPPIHLYGFTKKSLITALAKTGFEIKKIVLTSQLDWRYHPTTPSRVDSLRNLIIKIILLLFGRGSTICIYAKKPNSFHIKV